jgi:hypothetical protein
MLSRNIPFQQPEVSKTFFALQDYEAKAIDELSIKTQDQLEIIDDQMVRNLFIFFKFLNFKVTLHQENWLYARNVEGKEGWIPYKYAASFLHES